MYFDGHIHRVARVQCASELDGCPTILFATFETDPIGGGVVDHGLSVAIRISILRSITRMRRICMEEPMAHLEVQFAGLIDPSETDVGTLHATRFEETERFDERKKRETDQD